jgi:hypothetical protein
MTQAANIPTSRQSPQLLRDGGVLIPSILYVGVQIKTEAPLDAFPDCNQLIERSRWIAIIKILLRLGVPSVVFHGYLGHAKHADDQPRNRW